MKGIIFNQLEAMVTQALGPDAWDELLAQSQLRTKEGYFVGPKNYPDEDLVALVATASRVTGKPVDELATAFGRFLLPALASAYPMFLRPGMTAKSFLLSVDRMIHVEVRKLHPDAALPSIRYEDPAPDRLVMIYQSRRQLCALAVGLIDGVGRHFRERIEQGHPACMKRGDEACRIECAFQPAAPDAAEA
jgi:hypothetical protein